MQCWLRWSLCSFHPDPPGLAFAQGEHSASDAYDQRIPERGLLHDGDFFSGSEAEIEQTRAILTGTVEAFDAHPLIQGNRGQRPGERVQLLKAPEMKTTIIFNFHTVTMPEVCSPRKNVFERPKLKSHGATHYSLITNQFSFLNERDHPTR